MGYHKDTFGCDGTGVSLSDSLENKTTFIHACDQHSFDHGGKGLLFTWVLLDWRSSNAGIRRRAYLAAGGNGIVQVNHPRWKQFLLHPGNLQRVIRMVPALPSNDITPEDKNIRNRLQQYEQ